MQAPQVTFYTVMPAQEKDAVGALRPVARLLKVEDAEVTRILATRGYAVLARFAKRANADGLRQQLHAFGMETFVLSDQDIRGQLFVWAKTASSGQGGMAFKDFADKPLFCPWNDIVGVMLMAVRCMNGSTAMLIDVHRRSTTITPRLDASHFDFAALLDQRGAGIEDFLAELESRGNVSVNRLFAEFREELRGASKDFGSRPGHFAPTDDALAAPYNQQELLAADYYSLITSVQTAAHAGD